MLAGRDNLNLSNVVGRIPDFDFVSVIFSELEPFPLRGFYRVISQCVCKIRYVINEISILMINLI